MRLALQAFQQDGDKAMIWIAWPLSIVMIETNDDFYRDWASAQLSAIGIYGRNYLRAVLFAGGIICGRYYWSKTSAAP